MPLYLAFSFWVRVAWIGGIIQTPVLNLFILKVLQTFLTTFSNR